MTINKLTGDKLKSRNLYDLTAEIWAMGYKVDRLLADLTTDKELAKQLKRQFDGALTIARKAYNKSIERQTL